MTDGEGSERGAEELAKGDQAEGADVSLEGVPVPAIIYENRIRVTLPTLFLLKAFLRSSNLQRDYVESFIARFNLIDTAIQEGDYATAADVFIEIQGYLRLILDHPESQEPLSSGKAVRVDEIRALIACPDLLSYSTLLLTPKENSPELGSTDDGQTASVANIIVMSAATSGEVTEAATVTASATGSRRRAPRSTAPRAAQA